MKTVALIDWNWHGHHPNYFVEFSRALALNGANVVPFCPSPAGFEKLMERKYGKESWRSGVAAPVQIPSFRATSFRPRRWRGQYEALLNFARLGLHLRHWEKQAGLKIGLVVFACVYDKDFLHFRLTKWTFPWMWTGLYLHSFGFRPTTSPLYAWAREAARPERFLSDGRMIAVATLDEGIVKSVNAAVGGDKCIALPDVADASVPDCSAGTVGADLRARAGDRPVITLCGSLYPQRGVELFLRTAMVNPQWCFALVGDLPFVPGTHASTKALLDEFLRRHPCGFYHPQTVPDGPLYNGIIASSDVIWNVHIDWPGSSNTLTKAALFERPVVVSDRHLLGERVGSFRLGEVCDEDSVTSVSAALQRILGHSTDQWRAMRQPRWREYREMHKSDHLITAFGDILERG